jgi:hypothetical protein
VQQGKALQIRGVAQRTVFREHLTRAHGHKPLIHELLAIEACARASAHAHGRMKVAAREIDRRARSVNAQLNLRMAVMKLRQTGQQPFLQVGGKRADAERAAPPVLP